MPNGTARQCREKAKYAMWRAATISKALKAGAPPPPPQSQDGDGAAASMEPAQQPRPAPLPAPQPTTQSKTQSTLQPAAPTAIGLEPAPASVSTAAQADAKKHAQYAISALQVARPHTRTPAQ